MKLKNKLISLLSVLLIAPAFLLACTSGGGSGGGEDDPEPGPEPIPPEILEPLKFTATQDGSSVGYSISDGSLPDIHIQYSLDDGVSWVDWTNGLEAIDLNNEKSVCVRNTSNKLSVYPAFFQFTMAGKIKASGDISSMINYSDISENCFYCLFNDCTSLFSAPTLPAITLKEGCYQSMFQGCLNLVTPPELPATTLVDSCYSDMFHGCANLESTPELKAISLVKSCYENMFYDCTSLESTPISLPAEKLAEKCYDCMFYGCTSLESAPISLPAIDLEKSCYHKMFCGCSALTSAPELPANELKDYCYYGMFEDCGSLKITDQNLDGISGKIFKCPSTDNVQSPVSAMFTGTNGSFSTGTPTKNNTYYWYIE